MFLWYWYITVWSWCQFDRSQTSFTPPHHLCFYPKIIACSLVLIYHNCFWLIIQALLNQLLLKAKKHVVYIHILWWIFVSSLSHNTSRDNSSLPIFKTRYYIYTVILEKNHQCNKQNWGNRKTKQDLVRRHDKRLLFNIRQHPLDTQSKWKDSKIGINGKLTVQTISTTSILVL